jgi:hypothetical protein
MARSLLVLTTAEGLAYALEPAYDLVVKVVMTPDRHTLCYVDVSEEQLKRYGVKAATGAPVLDMPFAIWDPKKGKAQDAIMGGITFPFSSPHPVAAELEPDHPYLVSPLRRPSSKSES